MITICTHKSPEILSKCLSSIRKFSLEKHRVVVVETSEDQLSKDVANNYDCEFINSHLKYEIGAYNTSFKNFPDEEEYFCFQDSVEIVKKDWEKMFRVPSCEHKMVGLCSYPLKEDPCQGCGKNIFESLFNKEFPVNSGYGVLTNNFYLPKYSKDKFIEFGIEKLVANNKADTYATERILGAIAYYSCGYASTEEEVGKWVWDKTQFVKESGFTQYVYKHTLMRQ